jgi:hypothetical protein
LLKQFDLRLKEPKFYHRISYIARSGVPVTLKECPFRIFNKFAKGDDVFSEVNDHLTISIAIANA